MKSEPNLTYMQHINCTTNFIDFQAITKCIVLSPIERLVFEKLLSWVHTVNLKFVN